MFTKTFVLFFVAFFAIYAVAAPNSPRAIGECNTGDAQCCNSVGTIDSYPEAQSILSTVGITLQGVNAIVGIGCTAITGIGAGQTANCAQQPVCCTENKFNGLINIGCSPISL